jgi:hypothetical protein
VLSRCTRQAPYGLPAARRVDRETNHLWR